MSRRGEHGFILVAALWLLAALAALASAYAVFAVETAPSASLPEERLRAEAAFRAGVELCAFRQLAWPKKSRPDGESFSAYIGQTQIEVVYRTENARIDINKAPHDLIAGLLQQVGASSSAAASLADRVVGWRQKTDDDHQQEAAIYAKAGLGYAPPGAPFNNALEIALLPGMTPAMTAHALPYITVFGAAKIDPLVADPVVLAALPGATQSSIKRFLAARRGPPPDSDALSQMAGPAKEFVALDPSDYVRAEIVATLNKRRIRAEVVLKINEKGPAPYDLLSWRDDFDGD